MLRGRLMGANIDKLQIYMELIDFILKKMHQIKTYCILWVFIWTLLQFLLDLYF